MPGYEMVDSGITWLGKIPVSWKKSVVKRLFYRKKEEAHDPNPTILSLARTGVKVRDISNNEGQLAESYYNYNVVRPYDLLLNPMDLQSGANCSMSLISGVISPAYINLGTNKHLYVRYFDYYFKVQYWTMAFFTYGKGVSFDNRWTLGFDTLMNYPIIEPSYEEQKAIADYLDSKCSLIDEIIEEAKASIAEYKEWKNSLVYNAAIKGIDDSEKQTLDEVRWLDPFPKHWAVERGKHILKVLDRPVEENDEIITCFRDGEVTLRKNRREEGFTNAEKEIGYQGVAPGDLVVHGMDGFAGAIGISDSRGKGSPVLIVLDTNQNKKYICYYLRALAYRDVFMSLSTGIRVRSCDLSWNKLSNLLYLLPPVDEQEKIVNYIENSISKIDSMIMEKQNLISELELYRRSLVFEYVTGKRRLST